MSLDYGRTNPFQPEAGVGTIPLAFSTATTSAVQVPATSANTQDKDQIEFNVFGSVDCFLYYGTSSASVLAAAGTGGALTSASTGTAIDCLPLRAGSIQTYSFTPGLWYAGIGTATGGFLTMTPGAGA